ncbi:MAG: DUF2029 domain-containing protein [Chloroflexota bacterium]|nr:DUF2029 domain-containing protein [Chloroflexota bacterium]MDQ5865794.1 DUF2029 domain-containing protein [Chloroflexota bacterium]
MRQGISLYSLPQLHDLAPSLTGPYAETLFQDPFTSYIGPPSTALLFLPFTFLPFDTSVAFYRVVTILLLFASVYLVGLALPANSRFTAWAVGGLSLFSFSPVVISVGLGQVDAFVMVALALGIWAAGRGRWWLVGGAFGFAALLKISPALLLLYLLCRGKYQAILGAAITIVSLLALAALAGTPGDLWLFLSNVAPSLSSGSLHMQNQSLPAWIARLLLPETDLLTFSRGLGTFSLLGLPLAGISTIVLWHVRRRSQLSNLDYSMLILIGLLAGPITWDHYTSWSILALMLLVSRDLWQNLTPRITLSLLCALAVAAALMIVPTFTFSSEDILSSPWLRILTGTKTVALLLFCAVTLYMLVHSNRSDSSAAVVLRT